MHNLDDILQHSGVKGMRWGIRRNNDRPGGADGRPDANDNKATSKLGKHLNSMKRERQWKSVLKELNDMTTKDIHVVKKRVDLENDLKRLSKTKVATKKDKQDYLRRDKMTNEELTRKVNRLRAKDGLYKSIRDASKEQREFGEKAVQVASSVGVKYALTKSVTAKDIFDAVQNPKNSSEKAQQELVNKISTKNKATAEVINSLLNSKNPKGKS